MEEIQRVVGFRYWFYEPQKKHLISLRLPMTIWMSQMEAVCTNFQSSHRSLAPERDCHCGLYALHSIEGDAAKLALNLGNAFRYNKKQGNCSDTPKASSYVTI